MKHLHAFIRLILLYCSVNLHATIIDVHQEKSLSILEQSRLYITEQNLSLSDLIKQNLFQPYTQSVLNIGISKANIWIYFKLKNNHHTPIDKVLLLQSPLLEHIALYESNDLQKARLQGVEHLTSEHHTLFPFYPIHLNAGESKEYYLQIHSNWTPIDFSIKLLDEKTYLQEDKEQQLIKVMLLSMITILMIYSMILSFYMRDKDYLFYSFYLLTLLYQQSSYLGLSQIYLPLDFIVHIEIRMALTKVALMIISASLFAIFFLKTAQIPLIHRIYKGFIILAILEIIILNLPGLYNLTIVTLTSLFLVIFNLIASIISYRQGNKQARLFILGFGIVSFSYILLIANALGLISIMQHIPNTLIWGTTLEALILSLAFADRYMILQAEKEKIDQDREQIIRNEVIEKTAQLNQALKAKELLLKEVHHRVKNNLQIILSMVRLQGDRNHDRAVADKFVNLENRINAISKTYNLLLPEDNLDAIDMEEYVDSLMLDIHETMCYINCNIHIQTDINASLPLRESVYIGLIINELVTNAYKYAFEGQEHGTITIILNNRDKGYTLIIRDSGKGFNYDQQSNSLGLKLIHTLVYEQLGGTIEMSTQNSTEYTIRFTI